DARSNKGWPRDFGRKQRANNHRTAFASRGGRNVDSSRITPGKFPARVRARSINRRRQNQCEDRSGPRDVDSAQSRARQAPQDHCLVRNQIAEVFRPRATMLAAFSLVSVGGDRFCAWRMLACVVVRFFLIWRQRLKKKQPVTNWLPREIRTSIWRSSRSRKITAKVRSCVWAAKGSLISTSFRLET